MFIVGTKIDLRENKEAIGQLASQGLSPVKREQGIKLANKIRAVKYMECSALTQRGLKQVYCSILFKTSTVIGLFVHNTITIFLTFNDLP